jgi:hypothetical protein
LISIQAIFTGERQRTFAIRSGRSPAWSTNPIRTLPSVCTGPIGPPDKEQRSGGRSHDNGISWEARLTLVREWLGYLKREVTSPDLCASFKESQALQTAATSTDIENAPFTPVELETVELKLDELKRYITEKNDLPSNQIAHLDDQISYLAEASSRLGRKDWYNTLIAVLFSIVVAGIFAPDRAQELF